MTPKLKLAPRTIRPQIHKGVLRVDEVVGKLTASYDALPVKYAIIDRPHPWYIKLLRWSKGIK